MSRYDKPKAYTSRSLNDCERKYDTYEKEALAIIQSIILAIIITIVLIFFLCKYI